MNKENEINDSTNIENYEEEVETTNVEETSTDESSNDEDLNKLSETNKKLYIRAKKAEEELKRIKKELTTDQPKTEAKTGDLTDMREEIKLYAQGLSDEDVEMVKKIAKIENISLTEAKNSATYNIYKEKLERQKKEELSNLGASKSSNTKKEKSVSEMTREEHQAFIKKSFGR